jgi:hypothetical protein
MWSGRDETAGIAQARPVTVEGTTMTHYQPASRPPIQKAQVVEMLLRMAGGGLTVGLLIVLPALKILGVA